MEREQLKHLLTKLRDELEQTESLDVGLQNLAADLDNQLDRLAHEEDHQPQQDLGDQIDSAAANFAANHPRAEAILRELADILGKMGI